MSDHQQVIHQNTSSSSSSSSSSPAGHVEVNSEKSNVHVVVKTTVQRSQSEPVMEASEAREQLKRTATDIVARSKVEGNRRLSTGLRRFSLLVCERLREWQLSSYNEIATTLLAEMSQSDGMSYEEKNVRRRIYDTLNVLAALGIIEKNQKKLTWIGMEKFRRHVVDMSQNECVESIDTYRERKTQAIVSVTQKRRRLEEATLQYLSLVNLYAHNKKRESSTDVDQAKPTKRQKLSLPFVLVNTSPDTVIHCDMAESRRRVLFNYDRPFEIYDDNALLKDMFKEQVLNDNDQARQHPVLGQCTRLEQYSALVPHDVRELLPRNSPLRVYCGPRFTNIHAEQFYQ